MIYSSKGLRNLDLTEIVTQVIIKFIQEDAEYRQSFKRQRRSRKKDSDSEEDGVVDIWETAWGKMITHRRINNPCSSVAKKFRRRFRIPFSVFDKMLVPLCREGKIFGPSHKMKTPIEFKILVALRILARGNCADDIEEFSSIPENSCNYYFKRFVLNFAEVVITKLMYHSILNFFFENTIGLLRPICLLSKWR